MLPWKEYFHLNGRKVYNKRIRRKNCQGRQSRDNHLVKSEACLLGNTESESQIIDKGSRRAGLS